MTRTWMFITAALNETPRTYSVQMGLAYPTTVKIKDNPRHVKHRGLPNATLLISARFSLALFLVAPLASSFSLHDDFPLFDQGRMLIIQATSDRKVRELDRLAEYVQSEAFWNPFELLIEGPVED